MHLFYKRNNILRNLIFKNRCGFIPKQLKKKKKKFLVAGDLVNIQYFKGNLLRSFTGFVLFRKRLHNNAYLCLRNVYAKTIVEYGIYLDSAVLFSLQVVRRRIIRKRTFRLKYLRKKARRFSNFYRFGYL